MFLWPGAPMSWFDNSVINFEGTGNMSEFHVAQMLYGWTFSHCTDVPPMFLKGEYFLCIDNDKIVFSKDA